jgi:hypothetical protein
LFFTWHVLLSPFKRACRIFSNRRKVASENPKPFSADCFMRLHHTMLPRAENSANVGVLQSGPTAQPCSRGEPSPCVR